MPTIGAGSSFRSGLALPEHRQLYDYWLSLHRNGDTPCRSDFKPSAVGRLLPSLTLIDVNTPLAKSTIRLAGTRIVEMYNAEITGRSLDELGWETHQDYWLTNLGRAAVNAEPVAGVLAGKSPVHRQTARYWLRLPMRNRSERVAIILGHDVVVPVADQHETEKWSQYKS